MVCPALSIELQKKHQILKKIDFLDFFTQGYRWVS